MGSSPNACTLTALNYSGIYLSPFEYYGIDNWHTLERIGRIFEEQLRLLYPQLKQGVLDRLDQLSFSEKQYTRKTFKWELGEIDKDIHTERYTPLYTSTHNIQNNRFAGVNENEQTLMSQEQFEQTWNNVFKRLEESSSKEQAVQTAKKASKSEKYQCCMLDFLCYKAIILYLAGQLNQAEGQLGYNYNNLLSQDFDQIIQSSNKDKTKALALIKRYQQFMQEYFQRIDVQTKINTTQNYFFSRKGPDIICLTEATQELRQQLQSTASNFALYGPADTTKVKQTLLLIRNTLPFKPNVQSSAFVKHMLIQDKNQIFEPINPKQPDTINLRQSARKIQAFSKHYAKGVVKQQLASQLANLQKYPEKTISQIHLILDKFIDDPFKTELDIQLKTYVSPLIDFMSNHIKKQLNYSEKQIQKSKQLLQKLPEKGLLVWAIDITLTRLTGKNGPVVIGSFHLTSNPQKNLIQVQILGLIIYHLINHKKCSIIFGGDFNSYISLKNRDNILNLFAFVQHHFPQNLDTFINKINVYPKHPKMITTKKKRTILQPQVTKANELAEKCIDQLITTYPIKYDTCHICEIKDIGTKTMSNENFLPHLDHPYDHFLVQGVIDLSSEVD